MINTVVRYLVNNALKFSGKGNKITIGINRKDKMLEVLLKDEGTGILPGNLEKLFKIDQKFKTGGTANEKGTGLGIILAREFVEKNGGKMIVESISGQGSTFGFTMPASG
jgi:signal transduction histidine kinase